MAVLGVLAAGLVAWQVWVRDNEPDQPGAFYTPPDGEPSGPAGSVIRSEALDDLPAGVQGWRVLYRSTDRTGAPNAVSGIVLAPSAPASGADRPVVAWAHGTTGIVADCAPSIGAPFQAVPSAADLVGEGYVVVATDYPGLGVEGVGDPPVHPYLVGQAEGQAVLDSVRAARAIEGTGAGSKVALWGHSQGGHAALFATQLATSYAPELQLVGVAAAAPATELAELFQRDLDELAGKVLASMAVVAWSRVYPGASLDQVLQPVAIPLVTEIAEGCILTNEQALSEVPEVLELRLGFVSEDPSTIEPWKDLFAENTPGHGPLAVPLFVAQGAEDTTVWPDVTEAFVQAQCAAGTTVSLKAYPGIDHFGALAASAPDVVAWIKDRFSGAPAPSTC